MTTLDVAMPGLCPCGEVASKRHPCEFRPVPRRCPCGEWTTASSCLPCRSPEPPPMPDSAVTATVPAEHVPLDVLWLHRQTRLVVGEMPGRQP